LTNRLSSTDFDSILLRYASLLMKLDKTGGLNYIEKSLSR